MSAETRSKILKAIIIVATIYVFLLSIKLLGHSFKLFGKGFAETMLTMTDNPFSGLIIGIVATSLIQSSSTTTSIVVGMVAGGALTLSNAIPIIMGANIGTTITVKDLFFNTPARRKFLKSPSAEIGRISKIIKSLALGHPKVAFHFEVPNRIVLELPIVDSH